MSDASTEHREPNVGRGDATTPGAGQPAGDPSVANPPPDPPAADVLAVPVSGVLPSGARCLVPVPRVSETTGSRL